MVDERLQPNGPPRTVHFRDWLEMAAGRCMVSSMIRFSVCLVVTAAVMLTGCGKKEVTVYDVPRDERQPQASEQRSQGPVTPMMQMQQASAEQPMPAMSPMLGQSLPQDSLGTADTPAWQVPPQWRQGPPSQIRRGSFLAGPPDRQADIAVTVFPGDVGGLLANVNRWRQQVGLGPVSEAGLRDLVTELTIDDVAVQLVEFSGQQAGTISAIIPKDGQTWFFRMTAPPSTLAMERENFLAFINSISFPR